MNLSIPQIVVAALVVTSQVLVVILMLRRGLRSAFPMFFTYLTVNVVSALLLLAAYVNGFPQYFYLYWTLSTIIMVVGFVVIYEVFVDILKPFSAVIDLGKMLFFWAALFLLLAAFLTAVVTNAPSPKRIVVAVDLCDRCVHLMQCGMMMLLVVLEKRLNFSWRSSGMAIALGLGVAAAADLAASYGQNRFPNVSGQLDLANSVAYAAVVTFWALRLMSSQSAPKTVASTPSRLILQRWNEALIGYGYGETATTSTVESFLPGIERTVDRVMARKAVS
ncbi:MAG TPA: hypothetical protein VIX19_09015 [Terriglobales bacterium]